MDRGKVTLRNIPEFINTRYSNHYTHKSVEINALGQFGLCTHIELMKQLQERVSKFIVHLYVELVKLTTDVCIIFLTFSHIIILH